MKIKFTESQMTYSGPRKIKETKPIPIYMLGKVIIIILIVFKKPSL